MSRRIQEKNSICLNETDKAIRCDSNGKLIFTKYRDKNCALLIRDNRLLYAAFDETSRIGSIYVGKVQKVTPNINACFVEINKKEICFLSLADNNSPILLNRKPDGRLLQGDIILVQIIKDAQKNKLATVTACISIDTPYFVLKNGASKINYSKKINSEEINRLDELIRKQYASSINQEEIIPGNNNSSFLISKYQLIVRSACCGLSEEAVLTELNLIYNKYIQLLKNSMHRTAYTCIYPAKCFYKDILLTQIAEEEYDEIITDIPSIYQNLKSDTDAIRIPIRLYEDNQINLNSIYGISSKIDSALSTRIWLKSGGFLIIQPTEALTVIDVNSGKFEANNISKEESAYRINREAAEEIAIQLRLRNLSGIIIVDFINMNNNDNRDHLMTFLKETLNKDKIKTKLIDMTPLGLVEITRKKTYKSLMEQFKSLSYES